jgi:GNAT superfamily N-acetyltransferase
MKQQPAIINSLKVSKAAKEDGPEILELLKERASHLKQKGSQQWSFLLTGEEDAEILGLVNTGLFYKITTENSNELIATFMLSNQQEEWDIHLWGEETNEKIVYLHKLAVALSHKGEGVGDYLVEWIKNHIRGQGLLKIRLDCVAGSEKLRKFYGKHGFRLVAVAEGHCLYEMDF